MIIHRYTQNIMCMCICEYPSNQHSILTGSFLKKTKEVLVRINQRFFQDFQPIPARGNISKWGSLRGRLDYFEHQNITDQTPTTPQPISRSTMISSKDFHPYSLIRIAKVVFEHHFILKNRPFFHSKKVFHLDQHWQLQCKHVWWAQNKN